MPDVFEGILGQPQVRSFLRSIVASDSISHAYLFTGPSGSNKTSAAYALAKALICEDGACQNCPACKSITRRTHPDVKYIAPEGARGYVISQIRDIVSDTSLAPIQAKRKVYILDRVDLMGREPANAFLKTLEEPGENVTFILLARTREAVLPTIVSRCQVVPFRHIPSTEAAGILSQNTGVTPEQARIAIEACGGSLTKAIGFAKSNERAAFRNRVLDILRSLVLADELDVIQYAAELVQLAKGPLDNVVSDQKAELNESKDFLSKSALRQIEERQKRALSAATLESFRQMTAIIRSWLRDILMILSQSDQLVINVDVKADLMAIAQTTTVEGLMEALSETDRTDSAIAYNVSPETCIDALLFTIRKVVCGTNSTH